MFGRDRQIFRSKALERVSSPDHLDQMIEIVNPKDWLPLVVLGSLIALTIVWSITARVPTTVSSRGILIHPRRVLDLQTLGSGRLESVRIKSGDTVKSGDIIGRLDAKRATLAELQLQDRAKATQIEINQLQLAKNSDITTSYSGRILEVFAVEGQVLSVGTRIATIEVDVADSTLINVAYFPVGDGKKIQPGMPIQVTPDSVERQRFGGITGVITSVSSLPVTIEGSRAMVGNAEVVQGLMQGGAHIEVTAKLDADPKTASGYRWSSSNGPPLPIGAGLTTSVRVTVENRAPLTYVLPFLRELTGVY